VRKYLVVAMLGVVAFALLALPAGAQEGRPFNLVLTPSGDPDGSGAAVITINPGRQSVCYDITAEGITAPVEPAPGIGSAHIHTHEGGGIAVDLDTVFEPANGGFASSGCVEDVDRAMLVDILRDPANFYLNVHTAEAPGGAVQADLGRGGAAAGR